LRIFVKFILKNNTLYIEKAIFVMNYLQITIFFYIFVLLIEKLAKQQQL